MIDDLITLAKAALVALEYLIVTATAGLLVYLGL
jgi:hypothetical protein